MASGWRTPPERMSPTAQALLAEVPVTLFSWSPEGLGIFAHLVPFHARMSVPVPVKPTDQALLAEVAATPSRPLSAVGLGLGTCFQLVPFQRRITVLVPSLLAPTAQALLVEVALALRSWSLPSGVGLAAG